MKTSTHKQNESSDREISKPKNKYTAKTENKNIHFGTRCYDDFTTHGDKTRRDGAQEDWRKFMSPGIMFRYVL